MAAVALGSSIIEVHFTDNKRGRDFHDHALSFEPKELESFIKSASLIKSSLGNFSKTVQLCEEKIYIMFVKASSRLETFGWSYYH